MKSLRQVETILALPKPLTRQEIDNGYHRDFKHAPHFDRFIALTYADASELETVRTKLLGDAWQEHQTKSTGPYESFLFTKGQGATMQCVDGFVALSEASATKLDIFIKSAGNQGYNPLVLT